MRKIRQTIRFRDRWAAGPNRPRLASRGCTFQVVLICVALYARTGAAEDSRPERLQPGLYEITTDLRMPHVELNLRPFTTRVCLSSNVVTTGNGLGVQSPNPLRLCPTTIAGRSPKSLTFGIRCPGPNAPSASALYSWTKDAFTAVITIDMGGKSMRLSELQKGRRVGPCLDYGQVSKQLEPGK